MEVKSFRNNVAKEMDDEQKQNLKTKSKTGDYDESTTLRARRFMEKQLPQIYRRSRSWRTALRWSWLCGARTRVTKVYVCPASSSMVPC
jgi:hypothetical protein